MKQLHSVIGLVGVTFLGTGAAMRLNQLGMREMEGGTRMIYRSRHVYLLLSGLLNLAKIKTHAYMEWLKRAFGERWEDHWE